jgi:hypothetical protein
LAGPSSRAGGSSHKTHSSVACVVQSCRLLIDIVQKVKCHVNTGGVTQTVFHLTLQKSEVFVKKLKIYQHQHCIHTAILTTRLLHKCYLKQNIYNLLSFLLLYFCNSQFHIAFMSFYYYLFSQRIFATCPLAVLSCTVFWPLAIL